MLRIFLIIILSCFSFTNIVSANTKPEYVVVLHGIFLSNKHTAKLTKFLEQKDYNVLNINYPSTEKPLAELVTFVNLKIKEQIPANSKVNYVGYSMGSLIIRAILEQDRSQNLGRVVFLAPPNHGSEVADFLEDNFLFEKFYGPAGSDLTTSKVTNNNLFGEVYYELGIIAGSNTIDPISSLIIKGEDDGKVSILSTKLEGMKEHIILPVSHHYMPKSKEVHNYVYNFLKYGSFRHK